MRLMKGTDDDNTTQTDNSYTIVSVNVNYTKKCKYYKGKAKKETHTNKDVSK